MSWDETSWMQRGWLEHSRWRQLLGYSVLFGTLPNRDLLVSVCQTGYRSDAVGRSGSVWLALTPYLCGFGNPFLLSVHRSGAQTGSVDH